MHISTCMYTYVCVCECSALLYVHVCGRMKWVCIILGYKVVFLQFSMMCIARYSSTCTCIAALVTINRSNSLNNTV